MNGEHCPASPELKELLHEFDEEALEALKDGAALRRTVKFFGGIITVAIGLMFSWNIYIHNTLADHHQELVERGPRLMALESAVNKLMDHASEMNRSSATQAESIRNLKDQLLRIETKLDNVLNRLPNGEVK